MLAQKFKPAKFLNVGFGLLSSLLSYKCYKSVGYDPDQSLATNFTQLQKWVHLKTEVARNLTEDYLVEYCSLLSRSPIFHQMNITSLIIYLASSSNISLNYFCVRLLSTLQFPDDVDLEYYLQQCNAGTLVGLARSKDLNEKWFEGVTKEDSAKTIANSQELLVRLLGEIQNSIPPTESNCSHWLFQKLSGEQITEDPIPNLMSDFCTERDNVDLFNSDNKTGNTEPSTEETTMKYLYILHQYSVNEKIVNNKHISSHIVSTLKNVMLQFSDNNYILCYCGNILANVCVNKNNRNAVFDEGILPTIVWWKLNKDMMLSLIADRVLFNLDRFEDGVLPDGIYVFHPNYRMRSKPSTDVIFLHGLGGSPFHTWRPNSGDRNVSWPKDWLPKDNPDCRILCVKYDSSFTDWTLSCPINKQRYSLYQQAASIKRKLITSDVGDRPVVWVAHSMGGLIVKEVLLSADLRRNEKTVVDNTKGIVFYSTPHLGSPIASFWQRTGFISFPSIEVLELTENSPKLKALHSQFSQLLCRHRSIECITFGEREAIPLPYVPQQLNAAVVVPQASSDVGYGRHILLDADHYNICKPRSRSDLKYAEVSNLVDSVIKNSK